jgi:perosamine synthetase
MDYFQDQIPLLKPWMDEDEIREVEAVLRSGWVSLGPKVKEFEDRVAAMAGAPYAVATNSATTALHLCLQVSGLNRGDRVVVPAHTCMATVNAIVMAGGVPVFADIDRRTFNLAPACAEEALSGEVRGILLVHQIGLPGDIDAFQDLARRRGLLLVEDAATAFGAKHRGRYLGGHGSPTAYSFHPRKMITTGEGGMAMLFDEEQAERARRLRSAGASISDLRRHEAKGTLQQDYPEPGYNYRLTDIQAAVGLAQLRKLDRMLEARRRQARFYDERIGPMDEVLPPYVPAYAEHSYTSYCITIPKADDAVITNILGHMAEHGISCRRGIPSLCHEPYFRETHMDVRLPNTDAVARQTMFLPIFPGMTPEQQQRVVAELKAAVVKFVS